MNTKDNVAMDRVLGKLSYRHEWLSKSHAAVYIPEGLFVKYGKKGIINEMIKLSWYEAAEKYGIRLTLRAEDQK